MDSFTVTRQGRYLTRDAASYKTELRITPGQTLSHSVTILLIIFNSSPLNEEKKTSLFIDNGFATMPLCGPFF